MTIRLAFIAGLLAAFFCTSVQAQTYKPFPGISRDQRTIRTQERVEELYAAGSFERALLIYEKELAPIGDKYAQYMVGYMHLNGQSVPQDKSKALAWYRIAAQRGEPVLLRARDRLIASTTQAEIAASNRIFLDLWNSIGDTRIIMRLIRRDMETLKARTGTRIPGTSVSGPATIYRPSGELLPPNYYRDVRVRLEARLTYLETRVEISDAARDTGDETLQLLEQIGRAHV